MLSWSLQHGALRCLINSIISNMWTLDVVRAEIIKSDAVKKLVTLLSDPTKDHFDASCDALAELSSHGELCSCHKSMTPSNPYVIPW